MGGSQRDFDILHSIFPNINSLTAGTGFGGIFNKSFYDQFI